MPKHSPSLSVNRQEESEEIGKFFGPYLQLIFYNYEKRRSLYFVVKI